LVLPLLFKASGGGQLESTFTPNGIKLTPGSQTFVGSSAIDPITGAQYQLGQGPATGNGAPTALNFLNQAGTYGNAQAGQSGALQQHILESLAQPGLAQDQATYQQQLAQYQQQQANYDKYSAMGTAKASDISNIVTSQPGFQFEQAQGINAIQNAASASGQLNSGNLLQGLNEYGQGVAQKYYQNYLGNLNTLSQAGTSLTNTAMQGATNVGNSTANAYTNLGEYTG